MTELRVGDVVIIGNPQARAYRARIDHIDKSMMAAHVHLIEGPEKGLRQLLPLADLELAPVTPRPASWRRAPINPSAGPWLT